MMSVKILNKTMIYFATRSIFRRSKSAHV